MVVDFSKMSDEDKKWRGRSDARTLAEAEVIKSDNQRYKNAQEQAQNMLEDQATELRGLSKIAKGKKPSTLPGVTSKRRDIKRNSFTPYGGFPNTPTM